MTDERRRRFQQIERPRAPGQAPDPSPGTDARFEAVERPGEPADRRPGAPAAPGAEHPPPPPPAPGGAPPVAAGHVDRFRPAAERPLPVDDLGETSQPFRRCCRCETDCSRYVDRCTNCGASLDTDEQRAFNQRLWAGRRAEAAAEAEAAASLRAAQEEARAAEAQGRRAMAEEMAREVGARERARADALDGQGFGWPSGGSSSGGGWSSPGGGWSGDGSTWTPPGLRLLRLIPDPRWRVGVGVGAVALAALLFLVKPAAGLVASGLLVGLFVPSGRFGRFGRF